MWKSVLLGSVRLRLVMWMLVVFVFVFEVFDIDEVIVCIEFCWFGLVLLVGVMFSWKLVMMFCD